MIDFNKKVTWIQFNDDCHGVRGLKKEDFRKGSDEHGNYYPTIGQLIGAALIASLWIVPLILLIILGIKGRP